MTEELILTSPGEESIGPRLARLRKERGLTTGSAAAKLHCDESILQALETERFAEIGARVFVQGHLRRYAEFLGAPVDEVMAEWSRRGAALSQPDLTQIPRAPVRAVDPQAVGRRIGYLAAAIVITVAAWWILQGGGVATPTATPTATPVASVPAAASASTISPKAMVDSLAEAAAPAESPASAEPLTAAASPPSSVVPAEAPIAPAVSAASAVSAAPAVAAPPEARGGLALALAPGAADSWVEIYDGRGKRLYFDLVRRGSRVDVKGAAPLRVLLGRADVTRLEIDGREVTIPAGFMFNGTAHFTIDREKKLARVVKPTDGATAATP